MPIPESVIQVAQVIGTDLALVLAGTGRFWVYVPKARRLHPKHWIVATIGREAALLLSQEFGGIKLKLPRCYAMVREWRDTNIRRWIDEGTSRQEIAEWTGLTDRQIRNIISNGSRDCLDSSTRYYRAS